ncbi:hypothetical protein V1478_007213 [Vespula squamosa]|uniref:Uncharacterized protein n=1 Tax=Vespula squamosa TaxID=30214 RepID=A0ABD2B2J4_VESSQ
MEKEKSARNYRIQLTFPQTVETEDPQGCGYKIMRRVLRKYQGGFSAFIGFMLTSVDLPFQGISQSSLVLAVTRKRTSENLTSEHARCPKDICAKTLRNTVVGIDLEKCWTVVKPKMLGVKSGRSRDTIEVKWKKSGSTVRYVHVAVGGYGNCEIVLRWETELAENSFPRLTEDDRLEHLAPCFLDSRLSFVRQTTARALLEYCSPSHSCGLNANGSWGFPLKPLLFYPLSRRNPEASATLPSSRPSFNGTLTRTEGNLCDLPADCSVFHILTPAFIGSALFPTSIIEN